MDSVGAVILGLVQGVTEFLPISSSGHLVLVRDVFNIQPSSPLAFDGVLHLATTAAVAWYFRKDLWTLLQALLRRLGRLPVNQADSVMLNALALGTVPAVVAGLALEGVVETYLQSSVTVAIVLFVTAIFFMYAEWQYFMQPRDTQLTVKKGILIGLFQMLALIPGMSRSGSTIAGGMLLGLSRHDASRFSFLLAIPITTGVGVKMLLELIQSGESVEWGMVALAAAVAFLSALIVIHWFLVFVRRYTLWPFVWYSMGLAAFVGYTTWLT